MHNNNNYNINMSNEYSETTFINHDKKEDVHSKRTRITRACDTCRRKKIKCDVNSKNPCTTCSQYGWDCTFKDAAKKRGPPKGYIENLENRLEKMEKLLQSIGSDEELPNHTTKRKKKTDTPSQKNKVFRYHGSSSGYHLMGNILGRDQFNEEEQAEEQKTYVVRSLNGKPDYRFRRVNVDDDDLIVVRDATPDEVADQHAEDSLEAIDDLIPRSLLSALVHRQDNYFNLAHTTLPVIDKEEYLDAFEGRAPSPPAPLLTYAICTYACFLLKSSDPIFQAAGIERDNIFQTLLERATILIRKEYLKPRIVTIQALVLLCAHPTYSTSSYRNWILTGMAVRMAQDLGLHRAITTVEQPIRAIERNKQLWFSVYTTDRWCCAVMGRPLAIADSDCDVDLPSPTGDLTMFVHFVKLSGILGEVLRRIYSPGAKAHGYRTKAMEQTVASLQTMLDGWFSQVPDDYKITAADDIESLPRNSKKLMEGGPMTICYHAVVSLLHRPFLLLEHDNTQSFSICRQAAKQAIDVARSIPYMNIANFGWNFSAYSLFQATLIHLYNCTNPDPAIAQEAKEYVKICKESCLEPLSRDIPAGPPMIPFLQTLSKLIEEEPEVTAPAIPLQDASFMSMPQPLMQSLTNENMTQSWLLNGNNSQPLSQVAWQQLFSTAGTPFAETNTNRSQGWDSFFMENQPNNNNNNMFM